MAYLGSKSTHTLTTADHFAVTISGGNTVRRVAATQVAATGLANTFTANQTISGTLTANAQSVSASAGVFNAAAGATNLIVDFQVGGTSTMSLYAPNSFGRRLHLVSLDMGAGNRGRSIHLGRNTNSGNEVAGGIDFINKSGSQYVVWPDASGNLRVGSVANWLADTGGTVVGTQTSNERFKRVTGEGATAEEALDYLRAAVQSMRRFVYNSEAYSGEEFDGIVLRNGDGLQRYGMDADPEHDAGKSLNVINAISDLMRVVTDLAARVEQLESGA